MKRPLTGLVVAYASGIWVGSLVHWPVANVFCGAVALLAAFVLLCRTRLGLAALLTLVFSAGILAYRHATTISSPIHITRLLERRDQNVVMRGRIVSDTGYRVEQSEVSSAERPRFDLELQALWRDGQWQPADGKLLVFVSETRTNQELLSYGDVIECSAILRVPPTARNPGTFDWRAWLARRNIQFTATIRKSDLCVVREHDRGNPVTALSLRLREQFERALHFGLEDEPKLAGVLAGMIIGERSEIPPETYANFQRTGVFHIFSVSGLNVALVGAVVVAALRLMRVPRRWCGLVAIPLLILYVFATGGRPGAVRSLVMACVWLIGWALVRPADALNTLAAAALVILVFDPAQLFDGGFVLSFAVVVALVLLTPPIQEKLNALVAPDPLLPKQFVSRWRALADGPRTWLVVAVSGSLAAWIGLLPLMAWYFNLFTPVSILANVVVIPLLGLITALGMMAMPAHTVWPWLALVLNNANFSLLGTMIRVIEWLGRLPVGYLFVQAPPLWTVWAYYALAAVLLSKRIPWPRRCMAAVAAAPALALAVFLSSTHEGALEITVLDLHDGASIFLNAPGERHDMLIDGGGDWSGPRVVIPFLRAQGVDRLAGVVLTRGDKAHAAGLIPVLREIPVGEVTYNGVPSLSKFYRQWIAEVRARQLPALTVHAGNEIPASPDLRLRVLNPPRGGLGNRSADNSLVLALEYGPTRVLLMSDAGETVEQRLLAGTDDLRANIVIKGRHGKESSCTEAFLDAVRPEAVVLAVGTRPATRYPQPDLRERLEGRHVATYRTDEAGAVTIRLTKRGYTIRTCLAPQ